MSETENLLFEIGVEELPATYVEAALAALPGLFEKRLGQARLSYDGMRVFGTPRRLAVLVQGLSTRQPDLKETVQGPPARVAFDAQGKPTKAAQAFARKIGCSVDELERVDTPKGAYLQGVRQESGREARELLGPMLQEICAALQFRKSMRWGEGDVAFGRPVRWLVGMLGEAVVDFTFAGVRSANRTWGHRFLSPGPVELTHARSYVETLRAAHVVADVAERTEMMLQRLRQACAQEGATLVEDAFLVRENVNLVEEPHVVTGHFEERFLELPEDVIVAVAKGHQRYFCARKPDGALAPMYLAVAGTAENQDNVRRGNDRVMRARLSDAMFFFREDLKVPLQDRSKQLAGIVFQDRLGTVLDKVQRLQRLVGLLGQQLRLGEHAQKVAHEGAGLCKCDLASLMVGEFPELQGEMGGVYARRQGHSAEVADVIPGHYQPKGASDATAPTDAAALVALADRLDTLVGCFAIGLIPTGAADPYALRRACLGVLRTVLDRRYPMRISEALAAAFAGYEGKKLDATASEVASKLGEFFRDRLRGMLAERLPHDVVDACLASGFDEPLDVASRVQALAQLEPSIRSKAGEVFKRAANIAKDAPAGAPVDPSTVSGEVHATETALYEALAQLDARLQQAQATRNYPAAFAAIAEFAPLLGAFFDSVFVMTEELPVRQNRLRMMRAIAERCSGLAHFNLLT